jgi:heme A synthase
MKLPRPFATAPRAVVLTGLVTMLLVMLSGVIGILTGADLSRRVLSGLIALAAAMVLVLVSAELSRRRRRYRH